MGESNRVRSTPTCSAMPASSALRGWYQSTKKSPLDEMRCSVLPQSLLPLATVLAAAPARIANFGVPIPLEKGTEIVFAPDIVRRPACHEAALRLIAQRRDELGMRFDAATHILPKSDHHNTETQLL